MVPECWVNVYSDATPLFLRALTRPPTAEEFRDWSSLLTIQRNQEVLQDLLWVLLNSRDPRSTIKLYVLTFTLTHGRCDGLTRRDFHIQPAHELD